MSVSPESPLPNFDELARTYREKYESFVKEEVNPGALERDERGATVPVDLIRRASEVGFQNLNLPSEIGGGGADFISYAVALEQVGYLADELGFGVLLSYQNDACNALYRTGRQDLIDRYCRPAAKAERFVGSAFTDTGDAFSFKTTVKRDGDDLVVNGWKPFITGGTIADVFLVFVANEEDDLSCVLVERDDRGVEIVPRNMAGLRSMGVAGMRLTDVRLPADRMLVENDALGFAQKWLNDRRVKLACSVLGRMEAVFETCVAHVGETIRYDAPLLAMQAVQSALGRMHVEIESSRSIVRRALLRRLGLDGEYQPVWDPLISAAKYYVTYSASRFGVDALKLLGGEGYVRESGIERFVRDAQGFLTAGGAQDALEVDLGMQAASTVELEWRKAQARRKKQ